MRYRTRVAIQAPVEVRDPAGGVSHAYETIPRSRRSRRRWCRRSRKPGPDLVTVEDRYEIVLAGHHPEVRPAMVVLDGLAVYDIVRVAPTLGRRETVLVAQRVAI